MTKRESTLALIYYCFFIPGNSGILNVFFSVIIVHIFLILI